MSRLAGLRWTILRPSVVYGPVPHNMGGPDEHVSVADLKAVFYVHAMTAFDYLSASSGVVV